MVGWLKFNIIEKIPFIVYLEIQCITFKTEKSFIAHPWIQGSVVGLEEYTAHDWRAATSGTTRSSYLVWVRPVIEPGVHTMSDEFIPQISCTIFLAFIRSKYITLYDSWAIGSCVKSWLDLMTKQNWYTKHFHKTTITSSWTLSKTKIPITIIKAQMR